MKQWWGAFKTLSDTSKMKSIVKIVSFWMILRNFSFEEIICFSFHFNILIFHFCISKYIFFHFNKLFFSNKCKKFSTKLTSHCILHIFVRLIYQKAFLNWLCQYLYFLNIFLDRFFLVVKAFLNWLCPYLSFFNNFFNRFCLMEKCRFTPYCLYCNLLTLRKIFHRKNMENFKSVLAISKQTHLQCLFLKLA